MADTSRADAEKLGRAIQIRRVEIGKKRPELAREADLSYPYISEIENGIKYPSLKALGQIAAALELSLGDLLARAEQPNAAFDSDDREKRHLAPPAEDPRVPVLRMLPASAPSDLHLDADPVTERRIHEIARTVVRAELDAWARVELPTLVAAEIRRQLRDAED